MKELKIALLVDIDNVKLGKAAFKELYKALNEKGEVVYCKFYGYNDRKHIYLSELITKFGYETAPFMRFKKRFSQLDTRIIVDAVRLNYTKPEINTYCIVAGDGDLIPLLVDLKSSARMLIDINSEYQEINTHMFDEHIELSSINDEVEVYVSKEGKEETIIRKTRRTRKKPTIKEEVEELAPKTLEEKILEQAEQPVMTKSLSRAIRNITERYNSLDFDDESNMAEKLKLINDIEALILKENEKGQGLFSEDEEVRDIFNELQEIVDEMKGAL